jgi:signal transduction histidine kinase
MPSHLTSRRPRQDLTRLESGNETSLSEPFDFPATIEDAVQVYRTEAERRNIKFTINAEDLPRMVIGDAKKIRTAVANLTANAGKLRAIQEDLDCR